MSEMRNLLAEQQTFKLANGATLDFQGMLFAETSWYNDETQSITSQKLYTAEDGKHVFSISESDGKKAVHNAYTLSTHASDVVLSDVKSTIEMPQDMWMLFVKELISRADAEANVETTVENIESFLKVATC